MARVRVYLNDIKFFLFLKSLAEKHGNEFTGGVAGGKWPVLKWYHRN